MSLADHRRVPGVHRLTNTHGSPLWTADGNQQVLFRAAVRAA
jgi:hypothetical protein